MLNHPQNILSQQLKHCMLLYNTWTDKQKLVARNPEIFAPFLVDIQPFSFDTSMADSGTENVILKNTEHKNLLENKLLLD